jgi:hypothetical protein
MPKSKSIKLRVSDYLIFLLMISLAGVSLRLFWKDYNQSQSRANEKPIATITFKRKSAERKFFDRVLWDRLSTDSDIYDKDFIRTENDSSAVIHFPDGNSLSLSENTMVQVLKTSNGGSSVSVTGSGAGISVDTVAGSKGFAIVSDNGTKIDLESGSSLSVKNSETGMELVVQNGSANIVGENGEIITTKAGNAVLVNGAGNVSELPFTVLTPRRDLLILNKTGQTYPILFSWKVAGVGGAVGIDGDAVGMDGDVTGAGADGTDSALSTTSISRILVETSRDKDFLEITNSFTTDATESANISLPNGITYWRVVPYNGSEKSNIAKETQGKIIVYDATPPELVFPQDKAESLFTEDNPIIKFSWKKSEVASSYNFKISNTSTLANPFEEKTVEDIATTVSNLPEGTWYWSVTPFTQINGEGYTESSPVFSFTAKKVLTLPEEIEEVEPVVEVEPEPEVPPKKEKPNDIRKTVRLISPEKNRVFRAAYFRENNRILFTWDAIKEAQSYTFTLTAQNALSKPIIKETLKTNRFVLDDISLLKNGNFVWTVSPRPSKIEGNEDEARIILNEGSSRFTVDVSLPGKVKTKDTGIQYGE